MKYLFLLWWLVSLSACARIYGIKKEVNYTPAIEIMRLNAKHRIVSTSIFDSVYRQDVKTQINTKSLRKDMLQPLQFWIFDSGHLVASKVNCDATGFPNLRWHIEQTYTDRKVYAKVEEALFYHKFMSIHKIDEQEYSKVMIINYSYFMGRQNRRFLSGCKRFLKQHKDIHPVYNNLDNSFL